MTSRHNQDQERLDFQPTPQEDFGTQHPLDQYLEADPDYFIEHPLKHKVEMDMTLDAAIGLDHSTLSLPQALGSGLKSSMDFFSNR